MRILHVVSSLAAGGAEVYVRDLSVWMTVHGHSICIAYVSEARHTGRSTAFESEFKALLDARGIRHELIGHDCRRRPWRGAARLRAIIDRFQPDVVHSHLYYGIIFKALLLAQPPLVYTHHNMRMGRGKHLYPFFNRVVDQYVGISRDCATALQEAGAARVQVIYNGVSVERLRIKNAPSAGTQPLVVQAVGGLIPQKNFSLLIGGVRMLVEQRPDLRQKFLVRIAGEGPLRAALQRDIEAAGLRQQVVLLGNRSDVPALLHDADLFVMSSEYEGLPIALLEALMTGLPVVATDVGACRDVVESCDAGVIVPAADPVAFAAALGRMLDDDALRARLSVNAMSRSGRFTIESACAAHLDLYNRISHGAAA